ncbi:hypothetical protein FRC20_009019 [Serendipita sp. 405]|nr:hypothetical protein FRC15_008975 [Serendipita sp. 397]KAG8797686.1 hypothetical protein FRC16_008609 [Serendipita sp. 398]KAG8833589.1 hypothetical protein FRC18_003402 [Serendipita sp. 400]KAG8866143.1 hypothetical protein FRC20_009019 [Serendipita sp. 405]
MSFQQIVADLPPHYNDFATELPLEFRVGNESVSPLVTITAAQAHLRLLAAFDKLKRDVYGTHSSLSEEESNEIPCDPHRAWVVFVNRAVHRFDQFMSGKWTSDFPGWSEAAIPPLDVIMVWHTYLLNPRTYYEDSIRRTTPFARRLAAMESMPLTLIASLIDSTTFEVALPSAQRESFFESTSGLSFMYSTKTTYSDVVSIPCPCCNTINPTVHWITHEGDEEGKGTGFAEPGFVHQCDWCSRKFNRSMMGVRKFCEELTRRRALRKVFFSETLLDPMTGKADEMLAGTLTVRLVRRINAVFKLDNKPCSQDEIIQEAINLSKGMEWNPQELSVLIHQGLRPREKYHVYDEQLPRVKRIIAAYSLPGYASIDLVAAVLRQGSFIEKMRELGWLEFSHFQASANQVTLLRAIARYHAFLDLIAAKPGSFLVPTVDIDLIWHTHQLSSAAYRADTLRLLGRTPNHDDAVQPVTLQSAYDKTAAAWKARFGVAYSVCGCMPDTGPKTKLFELPKKDATPLKPKVADSSKKFGFFKSKKSKPITEQAEVEDAEAIEPSKNWNGLELVSKDLDQADCSHPSDHNIHVRFSKGETVQADLISRELASKERVAAVKKGLERAVSNHTEASGASDEKEEKVKVDEWRKLQAERKEERIDHKEAFTTREGPNGPYYPYWGVSIEPSHGFFGAVKYKDAVGGCAGGCASCGAAPGLCVGTSLNGSLGM